MSILKSALLSGSVVALAGEKKKESPHNHLAHHMSCTVGRIDQSQTQCILMQRYSCRLSIQVPEDSFNPNSAISFSTICFGSNEWGPCKSVACSVWRGASQCLNFSPKHIAERRHLVRTWGCGPVTKISHTPGLCPSCMTGAPLWMQQHTDRRLGSGCD